MKLVRFGAPGREKPGIIDKNGRIRDLSKVVPDIAGDALSPASLNKIRKTDLSKLPAVKAGTRLGPCVGGTRHFIAIGLNYADHAAETGTPIPKEPIIFHKAPTCIVGPNDDTMIPKDSTKLDYECEIAIVIGTRARYLSKKDALDAVAGYCICNDVSERQFQTERGGQWTKGKGCETFGPLGPWLVTKDEIANVQKLDMWLDVNGGKRQRGNTKTMIFGIAAHRLVLLAVLRDGAGRRHHHRHAAGRRARHEARAGVAESRRRGHARHRGPRRAAAEDRAVQEGAGAPPPPGGGGGGGPAGGGGPTALIRGPCHVRCVSSVTAHTSASRRSGERPDERPVEAEVAHLILQLGERRIDVLHACPAHTSRRPARRAAICRASRARS